MLLQMLLLVVVLWLLLLWGMGPPSWGTIQLPSIPTPALLLLIICFIIHHV
jgi:hypothetical protein